MEQKNILITAYTATSISCIMSGYLIYRHHENFRRPLIQSKIIGIIWMVPIYSIDSLLSLLLPTRAAIFIDMLRDSYEAYVLYLFLALMFAYLGCECGNQSINADDYAALKILELQRPLSYDPSVNNTSYGRKRLRFYKFGVLQYCIIRLITALLAGILEFLGKYNESNFSFRYGYIYIVAIINASVTYTLYTLAQFYSELGGKLKKYEPISKFLCLKFIIFFSFWQSVVIAILSYLGCINNIGNYSEEDTPRAIQNLLICIEMVFLSFAMLYAFTYKPYTPEFFTIMSLDDNLYRPIDLNRSTALNNSHHHLLSSNIKYFETEELKAATQDQKSELRKNTNNSNHIFSSKFPSQSEDEELRVSKTVNIDDRDDIVSFSFNPFHHGDEIKVSSSSSKTQKGDIEDHLSNSNSLSPATSHQLKNSNQLSSGSTSGILNKNFAAGTALRDYNQMLLPVLLPTGFQPAKGVVVYSNPMDRIRASEDLNISNKKKSNL